MDYTRRVSEPQRSEQLTGEETAVGHRHLTGRNQAPQLHVQQLLLHHTAALGSMCVHI